MITKEVFKSPCKHPNGLQWTSQGLYVMDQELDDVELLNYNNTNACKTGHVELEPEREPVPSTLH